jgi:hypothetical protein
MSLFTPDATAHLQIHLTPSGTIKVQRHCARCKLRRSFVSSGKFRVNAQRKLLDVWLIYRCTACDFTWNHAIHERTPVRDIAADELQALMRNDPVLADRHAGDVTRLRAAKLEIEPAATQHLTRHVLQAAHPGTQAIRISIGNAAACEMRLDRVLAWGLSLQRREVAELKDRAALIIRPQTARALKRAATDGQEIEVDLARCSPAIAAKCLLSLGTRAEEVV